METVIDSPYWRKVSFNWDSSLVFTTGPHPLFDCLSFCLYLRPYIWPCQTTTTPLWFFKGISYQLESWWGDTQYHEADRASKCLCLAIFARAKGFFIMGLNQIWVKTSPLWLSNNFNSFADQCMFIHFPTSIYQFRIKRTCIKQNTLCQFTTDSQYHPDSKVHGANMGPTWVLSATDGPHVGLMYLAIWACLQCLI